MTDKKIVLVGCRGIPTNICFQALEKAYGVTKILLEERESTKKMLKRRIERLGGFTVFGQVIFQVFIAKVLNWISQKRKADIINNSALDTGEIPADKIVEVSSINSDASLDILQKLAPDIVIVCGTRIISKKILNGVNCKFINTHAGITPKYRGVHGAYWALANKDMDHCGVTVHYVDTGIDTGNIIAQALVQPTAEDNFATYPYLQIAKGTELLIKAITDHLNNAVTIKKGTEESYLWYHPTAWQYIYNRIFKGVK